MSCCLKDKVCMILDLEGFFVDKTFRCRELGYYTWQEDFGRHAFFMKHIGTIYTSEKERECLMSNTMSMG